MTSLDDQIQKLKELEAAGVSSISSGGTTMNINAPSENYKTRKRLEAERDGVQPSTIYFSFTRE